MILVMAVTVVMGDVFSRGLFIIKRRKEFGK